MLKIDVTNLSYEPKPYEYKGGTAHIRPWPFSKTDIIFKDGGVIVSGEKRKECFLECLAGWNFLDADGKPLPCTREVKEAIFDFRVEPDLVALVLQQSDFFKFGKESEEKNFTSGSDTSSGA